MFRKGFPLSIVTVHSPCINTASSIELSRPSINKLLKRSFLLSCLLPLKLIKEGFCIIVTIWTGSTTSIKAFCEISIHNCFCVIHDRDHRKAAPGQPQKDSTVSRLRRLAIASFAGSPLCRKASSPGVQSRRCNSSPMNAAPPVLIATGPSVRSITLFTMSIAIEGLLEARLSNRLQEVLSAGRGWPLADARGSVGFGGSFWRIRRLRAVWGGFAARDR